MAACGSCSGPLVHGVCPCCGGDCWIECWICGFDIPSHKAVLHYKLNQWVCPDCGNDCPGHSDYYELLELPTEEEDCLPEGAKRVQDQGSQVTIEPTPEPTPETDECVAQWDIGNGMGVYFCFLGGISSAGFPPNQNLNGDFGSSEATGLGFNGATRHHAPFRLKKVHITCVSDLVAPGYSGQLEVLKNGVPTGIVTTPRIFGMGDISSIECDELFDADDTISFDMQLFDELGVRITSSSGSAFGISGTWIYTAARKFLFNGITQFGSFLSSDDNIYSPAPQAMINSNTGTINLAANTPILVHNWRYQFVEGPTSVVTSLVDRDANILQSFPQDAPFDSGIVDLNRLMNPVSALDLSSQLGLFNQNPSAGMKTVRTFSLEYTLQEHPYAVLVQAYGIKDLLSNGFYVGPGQQNSSALFTAEQAKVTLPIDGRIHHPVAYSPRNVAYVGSWRIELQLDEQPIWIGFINPGDYYTSLEPISACVIEGQRVRWRVVRLSGLGLEPAIFGLSFLFGPEGTG